MIRNPISTAIPDDLAVETANEVPMALSAAAVRMRRLRERRRSATKIVAVEVTAADGAYLRARGFLREGETARRHLTQALQRLLQSIR